MRAGGPVCKGSGLRAFRGDRSVTGFGSLAEAALASGMDQKLWGTDSSKRDGACF